SAGTKDRPEGYKYTNIQYDQKTGAMTSYVDPWGTTHERVGAPRSFNDQFGYWKLTDKDGKPVKVMGTDETEFYMQTVDPNGFKYWSNCGTHCSSRLANGGYGGVNMKFG